MPHHKLSLSLYIGADGCWSGPIALETYSEHMPEQLLSARKVLNIPDSASHIFSLRTGNFLELDRSYEYQNIRSDDVLVVTDFRDEWVSQTLAEAFGAEAPLSSLDNFKKRLPKAALAAVAQVPYAGTALAALFGKGAS